MARYIIASERLGDLSMVNTVCMPSKGKNGERLFDVDEMRSFALGGGSLTSVSAARPSIVVEEGNGAQSDRGGVSDPVGGGEDGLEEGVTV